MRTTSTMKWTAWRDGSNRACVCRGDGQHPGKSEVDIRPDAFASPNQPFGLTKSSPVKLLRIAMIFWICFAKRVIWYVRVIVYQHVALKGKKSF